MSTSFIQDFIKTVQSNQQKAQGLARKLEKQISRRFGPLQSLHWAAKAVYKSQGYRWEVRRYGELKLGYWRKTLRTKNKRAPYPKRLVLMPGLGDTPLSWHGVVLLLQPLLKRHFDEVVLLDFPGFGGFLSRERAFTSVDHLVSAVSDVLDTLKPHTVLGHSMGGWLAGTYSALCGQGKRPVSNRLNYSGPETLVVVNPAGIYPDEKTRLQCESIIKKSLGLWMLPDGNPHPENENGFKNLRPHLFAKEPSWFHWIAGHFDQFCQREDISQLVESFQDEFHLLDHPVKDIQAKTWVIWGEKDTLIPQSCAWAWMNHLNNHSGLKPENHSCAIILKNSGHSPHLEAPFTTAMVLGQIFSGREPHRFGKRWWTVQSSDSKTQAAG